MKFSQTQKIYINAVTRNFSFLKAADNIRDAFIRSIAIDDIGFLVPISNCHLDDGALIGHLTTWRNKNVDTYPTQFEATEESTKIWMRERLLEVDDRILFLVYSRAGILVGHIGFNNCHNKDRLFEIDNVLRGNSDCQKGLLSRALLSLMEWARKTLHVEGFFLRVMDNNTHAIKFYERNDFVGIDRIPLTKSQNGIVTTYTESTTSQLADRHFLKMVYLPKSSDVGKSLILTAGPSISAREAAYAYDATISGWNTNWSKYLSSFEKQFAQYIGVKHAIATSSCTGALQIALLALDIGKGDEVIVPDQTWVATANAVRYVGATPIFADIELDSWNIDIQSIKKLVSRKTKAIIPVHMYGHPARMTEIVEFANKNNIHIVEDAAPAIGAEWEGKRCGSFGTLAGFSFQGAKLMVTGEGGMLVTNDDSVYEKALKIWDQGRNPKKTFWIDAEGVKFKMSNVQAALGLAQLERVDELIEMKRRIFKWYQEGLSGIKHIRLNEEVTHAKSIYWMTSILLDDDIQISRDALISQLKQHNIDSRPVFPAISQYPIWDRKQAAQPVADKVAKRALNLPSGVCLKKDEVMYVTKKISEILST